MKLDYKSGVLFKPGVEAGMICAKCGRFFKAGDTVSMNSEGVRPFKWIHKECEKP